MRLSNWKVPPYRTAEPPEGERVDRVAVVVMVVLFTFFLVRGVIPALIDGAQVGIALVATGLMLFALGLVLLPAWRGRRARRGLGRLTLSPQ